MLVTFMAWSHTTWLTVFCLWFFPALSFGHGEWPLPSLCGLLGQCQVSLRDAQNSPGEFSPRFPLVESKCSLEAVEELLEPEIAGAVLRVKGFPVPLPCLEP